MGIMSDQLNKNGWSCANESECSRQ